MSKRSLQLEPSRRIALVIDGIDHISRIRVRGKEFDPSRNLAETLSLLDLPSGTILIILSQRGLHLDPLEDSGAKFVAIPGLDNKELRLLATRLNVISDNAHEQNLVRSALINDASSTDQFVEALIEHSGGNALYATYLCRETMRHGDTQIDPAAIVQNYPPFDGSLKNYYDHIYQSLGSEAGWVADVISLVDFSITRTELREIMPDRAHHVDEALAVLKPVLMERVTQGGVRIIMNPSQDTCEDYSKIMKLHTNPSLIILPTGWKRRGSSTIHGRFALC